MSGVMKQSRSWCLSTLPAVLFALGLAVSPLLLQSAQAQEEESPGEMARESLELMMKSLSLVIDAIPQYEMPVITENGDIIIRRKQKDDWEDQDDTSPDAKPTDPENQDSTKI
ncbi:hypothetical protein O4H49_01825 [Kiloniella laminariae]|uniref:Uncharacterized protein n=1 Tax=Kiloniella laminariae TaxID=454162 RepID=A0ABT4LGM9_9PROT|nr:hypothetical protein [Kiloniella laminariae]MCZ4279496.1 hypothetical protein [Kiloniella laminariae]